LHQKSRFCVAPLAKYYLLFKIKIECARDCEPSKSLLKWSLKVIGDSIISSITCDVLQNSAVTVVAYRFLDITGYSQFLHRATSVSYSYWQSLAVVLRQSARMSEIKNVGFVDLDGHV